MCVAHIDFALLRQSPSQPPATDASVNVDVTLLTMCELLQFTLRLCVLALVTVCTVHCAPHWMVDGLAQPLAECARTRGERKLVISYIELNCNNLRSSNKRKHTAKPKSTQPLRDADRTNDGE